MKNNPLFIKLPLPIALENKHGYIVSKLVLASFHSNRNILILQLKR